MRTLFSFCFMAALLSPPLVAQDPAALRKDRDKLMERGMYREAMDFYKEKLQPLSDSESGVDMDRAIETLRRLNAWVEADELIERAVSDHPENPALLDAAGSAYFQVPHNGRLIGGDFKRGGSGYYGRRSMGTNEDPTASAGSSVDTSYRDRIRALQLYQLAITKQQDDSKRADHWDHMARALFNWDSWKLLQILTPLDKLPEWGEPGPEGGTEGTPWTKDGPVLHEVPASWDVAKNDGERWRFSLSEKARLKPDTAVDVTLKLALFSLSQFGTETLVSYGMNPENAKGVLEVDTLAEDECLAKTADGVHRFKLPAAHHFIALYRSILDKSPAAGDGLTQVFLSRRQFDKAQAVLEQTIAKHGPGKDDERKLLLKQITGNWGRFEPADTVPSGVKPVLPLVYRNATSIHLTASPVDVDAMLKDSVDYLKSNPVNFDWQRAHPSEIASHLLMDSQSKFIGKPVATWDKNLTPLDKHRESNTLIEVPIDKVGAWWVTGKMADGNEFHTLVWIVDSVIVRHDASGNVQWWVTDANSGAPVTDANIEFFGFRTISVEQDRKRPSDRHLDFVTKEFSRTTDSDGKTLLKPGDWDPQFQWLAVARKKDRSPAFFGFQGILSSDPPNHNNGHDMSYGISDRPLYKPGDTVHLKFFLRNVSYFEPDDSRWANQTGTLTLTNGRGEEALKIENLKTDALGSLESQVIIPKDAPLGSWQAFYRIENRMTASVSFRVEEYRKPEYEVKVDAPTEPVRLGDKFTATVKAVYFHGSPVRNADVEIIVKRSTLSERWFPTWRWDWLYGSGAWWNGAEASWHPTWKRWGCLPPDPPWWHNNRWTPDELVLKRNLPIGPDGTAKVEIDTAPAKQIHGDMDAKYTIEARVVDASRREERGMGSVIAARKPFEIVVWTNHGYAKAGEEVETTVSAATLAGKPVAGAKGTLKIYQLSMGKDDRVEEKETQSWPVETDAEGRVHQKFAAPVTGQYRLAASLTFKSGEPAEGAAILNIHGPGRDDPKAWKFGPLELVSDKIEYKPGDTLQLRVNSDYEDANVWLFLHITGGSCREAKRIQLNGKSLEVAVPLDQRDMPNMFIEAISVHGAQVHNAVKQILLPPAKKMIDVTLEPAKSRVKPQEKSSLRVTLRDSDGKPVTGITVLTIYDKSLEAITGGSNVIPIHENFWKWKNYFWQDLSDSLPVCPGNLLRPKAIGMQSFCENGDMGRGFGGGEGGNRESARSGMLGKPSGGMRLAERRSVPASAPFAPKRTAELRKGAAADAVDSFSEQQGAAEPAGGEGGDNNAPVLVRKDFADLLKWSGTIETDAEGHAEIPLEFPDNLTTWKARVWTLGKGTQVGEGTTEIIASKQLLVRLQAPRFLVEHDEAVLSAVVQNDYDAPKSVNISLELDGKNLGAIDGEAKTVEIAAKSETRVDWRVKALLQGEATLRMRAITGDDGDAVERKLPVLVHGMSRQDAWSRVVEPDKNSARILMEVPEQRRPDQSKLTVRFSPTVAGAVADAIPYLASYPYGCTEQTLNRFVPAVITQNLLKDLKINLAQVKAKRTNLNPQELGNAADRAAQWRQWKENPIFDEAEIAKMVKDGLDKLMSMQNADGGWGWFSGYGESSYPHTTAVVVHGLLAAKANGAKVPDAMLNSGIGWLMAYESKQTAALQLHVEREAQRKSNENVKPTDRYEKAACDSIDAFVRMVLGEAKRDSEPMLAFLYRDRIDLPVYAKCLVALEEHRRGDEGRRNELMQMISQFLKRDAENQTAYLDIKAGNYWWCWYGSEVEAHAWYLKLLAAVKPNDPDTRGLVKYLVNNRRHATYWESTRDTAFAVEAIAAYFKASGEDAPEMEVDVLLDGKSLKKVTINRDNMFDFDGTVFLAGDAVTSGKHSVELKKSGKGALYANAYLEVFSLEDKLRAAGLEVKVQRKVSKLIALEKDTQVPDSTGLVVKQRVERFRREPLADGATLKSGDRIEVELILESKNDYEYLLFSDGKAAGFEALDALSGYISGDDGFSAYMEPRDKTVDFFIRDLPRGIHTLRYQLRAEAPGKYKALPATASGMYAPELRGNSEDLKLNIE